MKKRYSILLTLISCLIASSLLAQDPNFSQFYYKETYYNPAFAGINPGLRGVLTNRQLWTNVPGNWGTYNLAVDFYDVKFLNGGFGLNAVTYFRGEGFSRTDQIALQYGKRLPINQNFIFQLGAQAQYVMRTIDYSYLTFSDQLDARFGSIYETEFVKEDIDPQNYFDFSAGFLTRFNIKKTPVKQIMTTTAGIAFHHLTEPSDSYIDGDSKLPMKVNAHMYSVIRINRGGFYNSYFLVAPGVMFESQKLRKNWFNSDESGAKTLAFGVNAIIPAKMSFLTSFYAGVWARKQFWKRATIKESVKESSDLKNTEFDALVFTLGYIDYLDRRKQRSYRLMYSYDLTVSNAGVQTGGTHEVTLVLEIRDLALPGKPRMWKYVKHPADRFFHTGSMGR